MKEKNKQYIRKAVAYARFSSNNQREESIDAQLRAISDYCEREHIQLVDIFSDEAQSAKSDNRDDFKNMTDAIFKGNYDIDAVLVHKFNRFARNKYDSALYKKRLRDIGIKVVSVTQPIDDSPEGRILESMIEAMDEYYSENLALEVKKGLKENALKGKHTGGGKLLGLSVDSEGYYYPNEQAPIVRRIFSEFANGVPKTKIVERLNREGHRNQYGRKFNTRTILDLLQNEKYIGNFVYQHSVTETIRLDGIIKNPIVDYELWEQVQSKRKSHHKPKQRKRNYFMTGKLRCGICGFTYCGSGSKRTSKKGNSLAAYYKCSGKTKHKNSCTNTSLNKEFYEQLVINTIIENVLTDNAINDIAVKTYEQLEKERKAPLIPTKKLKSQLEAVRKKQEKLMELFLDGGIDKDLLDTKNSSLKDEKRHIESQIDKNEYLENSNSLTVADVSKFIKVFVNELKEMPDIEFSQIVYNTFVDKITIYPDRLEIALKVDFSTLYRGDKVNFRGAICSLAPVIVDKTVKRKSHQQSAKQRGLKR